MRAVRVGPGRMLPQLSSAVDASGQAPPLIDGHKPIRVTAAWPAWASFRRHGLLPCAPRGARPTERPPAAHEGRRVEQAQACIVVGRHDARRAGRRLKDLDAVGDAVLRDGDARAAGPHGARLRPAAGQWGCTAWRTTGGQRGARRQPQCHLNAGPGPFSRFATASSPFMPPAATRFPHTQLVVTLTRPACPASWGAPERSSTWGAAPTRGAGVSRAASHPACEHSMHSPQRVRVRALVALRATSFQCLTPAPCTR
jgi:hypothetical protein